MPTRYTIREGDNFTKIAFEHGFGSNWQLIYDHTDNAAFRKKRPNPNLIKVGDILVIPDRASEKVDASTSQTHPFILRLPPEDLIKKAQDLKIKSIGFFQDYQNFVQQHAEIRTIADTVQSLLNSRPDRYEEFVDNTKLKQFFADYERDISAFTTKLECADKELFDLVLHPEFAQQLLQRTPDEAIRVFAELLTSTTLTRTARAAATQLNANKGSVLWRVFDLVKKTSNTTKAALEQGFNLLAAIAPYIVYEHRTTAMVEIQTLVRDYLHVTIADEYLRPLYTNEVLVERKMRTRFQATIISTSVVDSLESLGPIKDVAFKSLAAINLALATGELGKPDERVKNSLATASAVAAVIDEFRTLTPVIEIKVAGRLAGKITNLTLVGSTLDVMVSSMEAKSSWDSGDTNTAVANAVGAAAGATPLVCAALVFLGAVTAPVLVSVLLVSGAVGFAAVIATIFTEDGADQSWVLNSEFGKNFSRSNKARKQQIEELKTIFDKANKAP